MPRKPGSSGGRHGHKQGRVAHAGNRNPSSELKSVAIGRPVDEKYPTLVSAARGAIRGVVTLAKPSLIYVQAGELAAIPRWQNDASPDERETRILAVLSRMKSNGLLARATSDAELAVPFASNNTSKRLSIDTSGLIIAHVLDTEDHLAGEIEAVRNQLELPSLGEVEEFGIVLGTVGRSNIQGTNSIAEISSQLPELIPLMPLGTAVDLHPTAVLHRLQQ